MGQYIIIKAHKKVYMESLMTDTTLKIESEKEKKRK